MLFTGKAGKFSRLFDIAGFSGGLRVVNSIEIIGRYKRIEHG